MRRIVTFLIMLMFVMAGLPIIGKILNWIFPGTGIGEVLIWFPSIFWTMFKEFILGDIMQEFGLYIFIAIILNGFGFIISKKTDNYIWQIVSLICSIIALITGNII